MLLRVNATTKSAGRVESVRLKDFGLDERALQGILFRSLDRLLGEDELLVLRESRVWQEEPDLLALDRNGRLFIFEIKIWEARSENLLQVLRYGQIFGSHQYDDLDQIWSKDRHSLGSLEEAHQSRFGVKIDQEKFNQQQAFVVLTNGLDFKTREAICYWRTCGLDVRPWVYRAYRENAVQLLLELSPFRVSDDPYEDMAQGYFIVNTNIRNSEADDQDMVSNKKVAAYFSPWKQKIERLAKNDVIFLYRSGIGIVAVGRADGKLTKSEYHNNPDDRDEEYSMGLIEYGSVNPPLTAAEIKTLTEGNYVFRQTMFGIDPDGGAKLLAAARSRKA